MLRHGFNRIVQALLVVATCRRPPGTRICCGSASCAKGLGSDTPQPTSRTAGRWKRMGPCMSARSMRATFTRCAMRTETASPNGAAGFGGYLHIGETHRIFSREGIADRLTEPPVQNVVYGDSPKETHPGGKYLGAHPDQKLNLPAGAPCNICQSENEISATLTHLDLDGKSREIYAHGIRIGYWP